MFTLNIFKTQTYSHPERVLKSLDYLDHETSSGRRFSPHWRKLIYKLF